MSAKVSTHGSTRAGSSTSSSSSSSSSPPLFLYASRCLSLTRCRSCVMSSKKRTIDRACRPADVPTTIRSGLYANRKSSISEDTLSRFAPAGSVLWSRTAPCSVKATKQSPSFRSSDTQTATTRIPGGESWAKTATGSAATRMGWKGPTSKYFCRNFWHAPATTASLALFSSLASRPRFSPGSSTLLIASSSTSNRCPFHASCTC
mmetsp:Transcript_18169/g.35870  ORF Transcript_18169/g.35870 Transcript_18169/m.35870 type:complete len:205 (-) Transcript_18169:72-686(-)